jgi:hypothetical protein
MGPEIVGAAVKDKLDFLVIGAQKAGTTTLFEYLRRHSQIYLPPTKEAPYFSHDRVWERGWDRYRETIFSEADPSRRWGTITTHYMSGGVYDAQSPRSGEGYDVRTVPQRIRDQMPDVRLIAILREPARRALSHYQMQVLRGRESRSFEMVIDELLSRDALERSREQPEEHNSYITWGEYGRILTGYLDVFPREQLMIVFTDDLERSPEGLLRRLHEFIGVEPDLMPDNLGTRYRESSTRRRWSWLDLDALQDHAANAPAVRAVWRSLPLAARRKVDVRFGHLAYLADLWNRHGSVELESEGPTLDRLRLHYETDSRVLAGLLGENVPWGSLVHSG